MAIAEIRQHVGWDDRGVSSSEVEKVDNVLHRTLSDKRSNAQSAGVAEPRMRAFDYLRPCARRSNGGDYDESQCCTTNNHCRPRCCLVEVPSSFRRHVPEDHVIVRLWHARMATRVVNVDMIHGNGGSIDDLHHLVSIEVPYRHHVYRADENSLTIVGTERAQWQSVWLHVEPAETGVEIGKAHKLADPFVVPAGRFSWQQIAAGQPRQHHRLECSEND